MTTMNEEEMKSRSFIDIEDGVDGVERFNLGSEDGKACCSVFWPVVASCSLPWLAVACCRLAVAGYGLLPASYGWL